MLSIKVLILVCAENQRGSHISEFSLDVHDIQNHYRRIISVRVSGPVLNRVENQYHLAEYLSGPDALRKLCLPPPKESTLIFMNASGSDQDSNVETYV